MITCTAEIYRALFAHKIMSGLGAERVTEMKELPDIIGQTTTTGRTAEVQEWQIAGEVVARKVTACGRTECWARPDLAELAEAHLEAEHAEMERIKAEVVAFAKAHPRADISGRPKPLSPQVIQAAIRHSARIGRLYDMDSRGDAERGKFARQLQQLEEEGNS
jgi:hypothetical protein